MVISWYIILLIKAKAEKFMAFIQEVPVSNFASETEYPDFFVAFLGPSTQSVQIIPQLGNDRFLTRNNQSLHGIESVILKASLNKQ
jgi:hypothetical protein